MIPALAFIPPNYVADAFERLTDFIRNQYGNATDGVLDYFEDTYIGMFRSSRPEVFCKKNVLRNFTKFTGKHVRQGLFLNKAAALKLATLLKKRFWHRCFPVNLCYHLLEVYRFIEKRANLEQSGYSTG